MRYCQGTQCHEYRTKDRKKGPKDNKRNETRRRSSFYYLGGNACCMRCQDDWFVKFGQRAVDHFGRITQPKVLTADNAWRKRCRWQDGNTYTHFVYNYLTEEHRPITEQQYDNDNIITIDGQLNI